MWKINLKRSNVIFKRDFNEYKSSKSFKILACAFTLITILIGIKFLLSTKDKNLFNVTLYNTLFLLALIPPIVNIPVFTTVTLTRDKTNGTIENLLATPLTPKEIVHGKSIAVFLPGFIISILSPLAIALVVSFIKSPSYNNFSFLPLPLLLTTFIITPMFCYALTKFTIQLSMIKSPELAISPSYLVGFAIMIGIPICSSMGIIHLTSWTFLFLYLGITFFILIFIWSFSFLLTKERIILSNL